jgi:hypothetical protein
MGSQIQAGYIQFAKNLTQSSLNFGQDWRPNLQQDWHTTGGQSVNWDQFYSQNARYNMVDVLAAAVFVVAVLACPETAGATCYIAAAFAAGFTRGYGDAQLEGKSGQGQFDAGMRQGITGAILMAGAYVFVDALPVFAPIGPGTTWGAAIGFAFTATEDYNDSEKRKKREDDQ